MTRVSVELKKMSVWFQCNKMALNINKTKYIVFHVPSKKVDNSIKLMLDTNTDNSHPVPSLISEIERIHNGHANPSLRSFKLLGIYFDEHMNFSANSNALTSKLSHTIFFLNRVKHTLTPKALNPNSLW
jgi:hypothetical protein